MTRDPIDNADQPPEVDVHDPARRLPPVQAAAERVRAFVEWFGDGELSPPEFPDAPRIYARDLEVLARHVLERPLLPGQARTNAEIVAGRLADPNDGMQYREDPDL